MRGLRRRAGGRASVALLLPVLVAAIVLMSGGVALADQWTDISDSTWVNTYGVTPAQAAVVSDGYTDGTFRPMQAVTRGQFAKFTVDGFGIAKANPPTPSFRDVGRSNTFYTWIEGGVAAGVISGYTDGTFKPTNTISRQQSNNILGSYLSKKELTQEGEITGSKGTYSSLTAWYAAEGPAILAAFKDATSVASVHAPGTAYLVYHQVVKGSNGNLTPNSSLTRAQAVALIVRVKGVTFNGGGSGSLPLVSLVNPAAGPAQGGNNVAITGANFTGATAVKFGNVSAASFTVNSATSITAIAPAGAVGSTVDVTVTTAAGTSAVGNNTKYSYGLPTVTLLEPNGGSGAGGTAVTITGTGFTGVTYVRFGTTVAKSFVVLNPTTITAVSPAGTTGTTVDVVVTTAAGSSIPSDASKFTYGVPVVNKIQPGAGPAAGGTTITITGSGFTEIEGPAGVKFVSGTTTVNAPSYTVNSSSQITATVPPGTEGTSVDVVVTNTVGSSGMSYDSKYSYGAPTITKLDPAGGKETGGDKVFIVGTGFTGVTSVKFGATTLNTSSYTMNSPTQITVTATPPGTAGSTVEVVVTTAAGSNPTASGLNDYTYGLPTVTKVEPAAGPVTSGQTVVITGANLTGATAVKFGAYTATFVVNSASQITATSPGGQAGTVDVLVTTPAGTSAPSANSKYSFGTPTVSKLEPASGPTAGGNSVKITGERFTGVTAVKFGGNSATFVVDSPTQITATAPPGTLGSTVDVIITTPAGSSLASSTSKYNYIGLPTVTGLDPETGPAAGGNTVTITGTFFVVGTTVKFGNNSASNVTIVDETEMTVTAPAGTAGTTVNVIVTNPAGNSPNTSADDYSYGIPTVTGLSPAAGSVDGLNTVIITGSSFAGVTAVKFGSTTLPASNYTVNSLTQITAIAPPKDAMPTTVDVTVTNATGTSAPTGASKYSYGPPSITSMSLTGGVLTINGSGFTGTTNSMTVTFRDGAHPDVIATITAVDADHCLFIKVTPPAQGSLNDIVNVRVTTAAGTSADTDADNFYYNAPSVSSLNPVAGQTDGGNSVVITGTGFTGATAVKFGDDNAASFTVNSSTQITAIAPNGDDWTIVDVTVTGSGGGVSSASASSKYSFGEPRVLSLDPTGGPIAGGTTVTIEGSGFLGVSAVRFGSASGTNVSIIDYEHLTVRTPQTDTAGTVQVTVTNPAGTSSTAGDANDYTYGLPTITSVSPAAGPAAGGNTVTINGSGFGTSPTVKIGGTSATVLSSSTTVITVTAPPGTAGETRQVSVTNGAFTSADTPASKYSYGPPTVTDLQDSGGPTGGGNEVIITGTGFTGVSAVKFGATSATYVVEDYGHIKVPAAPAGSGTVDVTVTTPGGTSAVSANSKYSYGVPTITSLAPAAGPSGTGVVIYGTNLLGVQKVWFGVTEATFFVINDSTQITAMAPIGPSGTVDVKVENGYDESAVTLASQYSYSKPTVDVLSPSSGSPGGGTLVTITGTGFTGVTDVRFGTTSVSYNVVNKTTITATAPAGTAGTSVQVSVTNLVGVSTVTKPYGYGLPTVTSIAPAAKFAGESVTITGSNFTGATDVVFRNTAPGISALFTIVDATHITATVPPGFADGTTVDVIVISPAGESPTSAATKFSYGLPTITDLSPAQGANGGGTVVTITGTGFTGVTSVTFDGISASRVVNSPNSITATAPGGTAGTTVQVRVNTSAGESPNNGTVDDFYYY